MIIYVLCEMFLETYLLRSKDLKCYWQEFGHIKIAITIAV